MIHLVCDLKGDVSFFIMVYRKKSYRPKKKSYRKKKSYVKRTSKYDGVDCFKCHTSTDVLVNSGTANVCVNWSGEGLAGGGA